MAFDVEGARKAGYSDAEIADHLGTTANFDTAGARKAGYGDADLIAHLTAPPGTSVEPDPMLRTDPNQPQTADAPNDIGHKLGLGVRNVVQGVVGPAYDLVGSGLSAIGLPVNRFAENLTALGLPQAETPAERTISSIVEPVAGTLTGQGVGRALTTAANPVVQTVGRALAQQPVTQAVAAGTGGAVGEVTDSPLAGLAAGLAVPAIAGGATAATRAVTGASRVPPITADAAKATASGYYDKAEQLGGTLTPAFTGRFIAAAERIAPQSAEGLTVAGETPITSLVGRIQALRDKPISLKGAQEIDEQIGGLIEKEVGPTGKLSKAGNDLHDLQSQFRDMIANAEQHEVSGGKAGFDALVAGRKAWAQAMKIADLERIQQRSELMANPSTGIQTGIRTLLSSKRARGYSAEEREALKDAGERGVIGGALHVFGSRLIPAGVGAYGAATFSPSALALAGVAHGATTGVRKLATGLQNRRMESAINVLGKGMPGAAEQLPMRVNQLALDPRVMAAVTANLAPNRLAPQD